MTIVEANERYLKIKQQIEKKKVIVDNLEKNMETILEDIELAKASKILAQRANNKADIAKAESEIKQKQEELKKIKEQANQEKGELQVFQKATENMLKKIQEIPEMKEHLETVVAKRYDRKIKKTLKDREETDKKLEAHNVIMKMMTDYPKMKNYVQGMLNAEISIKTFNEELAKLDSVKDATKIKQIKNKIKKENKKLIDCKNTVLTFAQKKGIEISEETLEDIIHNPVIDKKTNTADIDITMRYQKKSMEKQIKGYDKQIAQTERALRDLGYKVPQRQQATSQERKESTTGRQQISESETETEVKPKWWQFRKRFAQWNERRLEKKEEKALPQAKQNSNKKEENEFAQSLKFEVIRDAAQKMQEDKIKEAKQNIKKENKTEEKDR